MCLIASKHHQIHRREFIKHFFAVWRHIKSIVKRRFCVPIPFPTNVQHHYWLEKQRTRSIVWEESGCECDINKSLCPRKEEHNSPPMPREIKHLNIEYTNKCSMKQHIRSERPTLWTRWIVDKEQVAATKTAAPPVPPLGYERWQQKTARLRHYRLIFISIFHTTCLMGSTKN